MMLATVAFRGKTSRGASPYAKIRPSKYWDDGGVEGDDGAIESVSVAVACRRKGHVQ